MVSASFEGLLRELRLLALGVGVFCGLLLRLVALRLPDMLIRCVFKFVVTHFV